ncbi:GAF domain-containing protein, partial [Tropicimonas sp.]
MKEDGETAFRHVLRAALRTLAAPRASIVVVGGPPGRPVVLGSLGLLPACDDVVDAVSSRPEHMLCELVLQQGRPVNVPWVPDHPRFAAIPDTVAAHFRACLAVPVFAPDGAVYGALIVADRVRRDWPEDDLVALGDLARCVSDVIALRTRLHVLRSLTGKLEAAPEREHRLRALRDSIFEGLTAPAGNSEERLIALLAAGCRAFGMDAGAITRVSGESGIIVAQYWHDGSAPVPEERRVAGALTLDVLSGRDVVHCRDCLNSCRQECAGFDNRRPGACIAVPLVLDGILYGALEFIGRDPREADWSADECAAVRIIGALATTQLGVM